MHVKAFNFKKRSRTCYYHALYALQWLCCCGDLSVYLKVTKHIKDDF